MCESMFNQRNAKTQVPISSMKYTFKNISLIHTLLLASSESLGFFSFYLPEIKYVCKNMMHIPLIWAILKFVAAILVYVIHCSLLLKMYGNQWDCDKLQNLYNLFKFVIFLIYGRAREHLNIDIRLISHISHCVCFPQ